MSYNVLNNADGPGMPTPDNHSWHVTEPGWDLKMTAFHSKDPYLSHRNHSMLKGMKHQFSLTSGKTLTKAAQTVFKDRGPTKVSSANPEKQTYFIPHSMTPQYDIRAQVRLDPEFAERLGVQTEDLFDTSHIFYKSGLNGVVYYDVDGSRVEVKHANAGSWDRESPKLQMGRRVAPLIDGKVDAKAPSYYYTGRPDSDSKALEQAGMIYFCESFCDAPKGIEEDDQGNPTLYYVVNSIQSNIPLFALGKKKKGTEGVEQEQDYFKKERMALAKLRVGKHTLEDPNTYREHEVRIRPMLFSRQVNFAARFEPVLDSWHSGEYDAIEASREGWKELKGYYTQRPKKIPKKRRNLAAYLVQKLEHNYNGRLIGEQMHAAEEAACRSMLSILLGLPVVNHCKSSTDRTSLLGALDETLNQWIKEGLDIPDKFETIIDDPRFKEFFWINWSKAAQFSRNGRSPSGIIEQNGFIRENDHEAIGLCLNNDLAQCVLLEKFLPEALLKPYGITGFLKQYSWKYFLGISFMLSFGWLIGLGCAIHSLFRAPIGTLGRPANWYFRWPYMVLMTIGMFFFNWTKYAFLPITLLAAAPKKVVDFDAPGIGPRRHLKEAKKYQRPFSLPLEAVPANAGLRDPKALSVHMKSVHKSWATEKLKNKTPIEIYNLFFEKRFCQEDRPLRYFMKGDLLERMAEEEDQKPPRTWELNGTSYENLDEVKDALLAEGSSESNASWIVQIMQQADNLSAHRYLQKILESRRLKVKLSPPEQEDSVVSYDTKRKTLTIYSQASLLHNREEHAVISTATVINANQTSSDYGKGYVSTNLQGEFTPLD